MSKKQASFRVGRVTVYRRGRVWYLCYHQHGRRHRPRVGPDKTAARQLAAQVNAQIETGAPTLLDFEPVGIPELREHWLAHHEDVLRSSLATIRRYRTASEHLIRFVDDVHPVKLASQFQAQDAEAFAAYLRRQLVAPNGHPNARKRSLRDKGVKFILEVCRAMFNYAAKRRHMPPYTANPFKIIEIDRMPVDDAAPFVGFTEQQEHDFFTSCDEWQFPIFVTLLMTGLRPGELAHLLLPDDLDLEEGWLHVRNKPDLGWRVKTRNERRIPLMKELVEVLRLTVGTRVGGTVFVRRRFSPEEPPPLVGLTRAALRRELDRRIDLTEQQQHVSLDRGGRERIARTVWRDLGMIKTDKIRTQFMRITAHIGVPETTAPKTLRHMFATCLQDSNVDPLIRNQLMGHAPAGAGSANDGLGMTGVYTHTRPATLRRQLEEALRGRPALGVARQWLQQTLHHGTVLQSA